MKPKPVEYHPGARLDLEQTAVWYEEQEAGVGERFQNAVASTEQKVRRNPKLGTPHRRNTRKWRVRRFPHNLVYREEAYRIVVIAIAHAKRREDYWEYRVD